jgi:hypothetical protein
VFVAERRGFALASGALRAGIRKKRGGQTDRATKDSRSIAACIWAVAHIPLKLREVAFTSSKRQSAFLVGDFFISAAREFLRMRAFQADLIRHCIPAKP